MAVHKFLEKPGGGIELRKVLSEAFQQHEQGEAAQERAEVLHQRIEVVQ